MAAPPTGTAQYFARFGEQNIACNPYAITKLGVDRSHCSLKIEDYVILCAPYQLGFKRSILMASLSSQELTFFQKYLNTIVGFSITLNPNKKPAPFKFFIRCTLQALGQMKGRENVGLFIVDFKTSPDDYVSILGNFLENQEKIRTQYDDYGQRIIRMTPETSKAMGYNMYATIIGPNSDSRRIQIFNLSSKTIEHLEAEGAPVREPGTAVTYQLFFQKYRVTTTGTVQETATLPQGMVRTMSTLAFSPELVEIIDDYWYNSSKQAPVSLLSDL